MKEQKIERARNMIVYNFNSWLKDENEKGWYIVQIHEWKTYNDSDRLDFVILMERKVSL